MLKKEALSNDTDKKIKNLKPLTALLEGIIQEMAKETGYSEGEIRNVVASQFLLAKKILRACSINKHFHENLTMRLHCIGKFFPSHFKYKTNRNRCSI